MYNNDIYPALQTFSIERLRKEQERALTPILAGRDVLVRLRTGGGKSLLYQLPTLLDEPGSLTLVFSPLRALQRDQVQALERRGVHAALLNSDLSTSMHADILRDFTANGGLLYLAPEQLRREDVCTTLAAAHVRRVVVDEAHILPQVEHAFRKDYRRIGPFIESLSERPQVLAFTATATVSDLNYIAERLCMRDPKRLLFPKFMSRKLPSAIRPERPANCRTRGSSCWTMYCASTASTVPRSSTAHASRMSSAPPNGCVLVTIQ